MGAVVQELAGQAGARLSEVLSVTIFRSTALHLLMRLPLPPLQVPRMQGVEDCALKHRHRYATVLTDAEADERIDALPGRGADVLEAWLRSHPGVDRLPGWGACLREGDSTCSAGWGAGRRPVASVGEFLR
ncbi:transposase [Nonomuraea sp. FMUSA5-5]|uniref:Transposase n=1 Tax=Nonomuraea composti TaxID=2720023 RepID=A0ABX1BPP8_9ACTN|nr:transposase [Nonomuraea sp. FMUSA5-5]